MVPGGVSSRITSASGPAEPISAVSMSAVRLIATMVPATTVKASSPGAARTVTGSPVSGSVLTTLSSAPSRPGPRVTSEYTP